MHKQYQTAGAERKSPEVTDAMIDAALQILDDYDQDYSCPRKCLRDIFTVMEMARVPPPELVKVD